MNMHIFGFDFWKGSNFCNNLFESSQITDKCTALWACLLSSETMAIEQDVQCTKTLHLGLLPDKRWPCRICTY